MIREWPTGALISGQKRADKSPQAKTLRLTLSLNCSFARVFHSWHTNCQLLPAKRSILFVCTIEVAHHRRFDAFVRHLIQVTSEVSNQITFVLFTHAAILHARLIEVSWIADPFCCTVPTSLVSTALNWTSSAALFSAWLIVNITSYI